MVDERYFTVRDIAELLKVKESTVRHWLRAGKLRGRQVGGTKLGYRVAEVELRRFIEGRASGESDTGERS